MIAALQMYDWPEVRPEVDRFWAAIRDALKVEGIKVPAALSRPRALAIPWSDPGLVLGQTCGLPYVSGHCGSAMLVARPTYGVEGTDVGSYSSALVCRKDDPRDLAGFLGTRAAINELGSQSGCNALKDAFHQAGLAEGPLFSEVVMSGGHRASANMVADGAAEIAAIDAVAWALHRLCEPEAHHRLRVLGWTRPMPSLPFITGPDMAEHIPVLRRAVQAAILANDAPATTPGIPVSIEPARDADYDPIRDMARLIAPVPLA